MFYVCCLLFNIYFWQLFIIVCYNGYDDVFIIIIKVLAGNDMQNLKLKTQISRK